MSVTRRLQRWVPLAGLGLVLAVALVVGTSGRSGQASVDDRVHHITSQIRCPVCSGETVADSAAPISQDIRTLVRQQVQAGRSDQQITAYIVHQYPGTALNPPATGVGLLVWALPVVVFVGAAAGLGLTFARWRSRSGVTVTDEDRLLVERARRSCRRLNKPPAPTRSTREALEQEREFLLRSLADLDAEHEAGDIEDDDYRSLTDDYTARAAAVLRAIDAISSPRRAPPAVRLDGAARSRPRAPAAGRRSTSPSDPAVVSRRPGSALRGRRRWRTVAVVVVVAGFGGLAAWAVAQSSGSRLPGETSSGNSQLTPSSVAGGVDPRLQTASDDVNKGDVAGALQLYDAVLKDDPNQPVALADGGWLQAQAGLAGNRSDLVDSGLAQIVKAEHLAPTASPTPTSSGDSTAAAG